MHKYVFTRGGLNHTKKWENDLVAQHLPFELKDKKGKITKFLAEIQLRPINLYEIIYPEACEKEMMGILKPSHTAEPRMVKAIKWLSKFLKLEKPSDDWKPYAVPPGVGVSVFVIGNKKDKLNWDPKKSNDVFDLGLKPQENL